MSSALETVTDYIADARILLQDTIAPYRYDDPSLVNALNLVLLEGRRIRPDLFIYQKPPHGVQSFDSNSGQKVVIEEQFRLAFLYGLVGFTLQRDQEDIEDARAASFFNTFNELLLGVRIAGVRSPQVPV